MQKRILVTGGAGFIGFHLSQHLLTNGFEVIGIDNCNDYYDVQLKYDRLKVLESHKNFTFHKIDLSNRRALEEVFTREKLCSEDRIVHLAAQAGVRYALDNPESYISSNLIGFFNLIELARLIKCGHMLYASSSSVYGGNTKLPFSEQDNVDHPVSLYAATKKSNELIAHVYSYTYGLPTTGLRFFTVYGPWGRPDMAYFKFTKAILNEETLPVYNHGDMFRDFTYIDDIVDGIVRLVDHVPQADPDWDSNNPDPSRSWVPYRVFNIGNNNSEKLMFLIEVLEKSLGRKAKLNMMPMQLGDVKATYADIHQLNKTIGFSPATSIEAGIPRFIEWYLDYYGLKE